MRTEINQSIVTERAKQISDAIARKATTATATKEVTPKPIKDKRPIIAMPREICRYRGDRVGVIDCGCQQPRVLYSCDHPGQTHQPAFCVASWSIAGPRKATYDAGATDEIIPASCLRCKLREAMPTA